MIGLLIAYFTIAIALLLGLAAMILNISKDMALCPLSGSTARAAAKIVATGYVAIGFGGVILGAIALPLIANAPQIGMMAALGLICLCLGLGFTQAMANLRQIADRAAVLNAPAPVAS